MISVGALAFGYLIMNLFSTVSNLTGDVCSTLFGSTSILTLSQGEVVLCVILSVAVVAIFIGCYNKLFAVTFDEEFSRTAGTKVEQITVVGTFDTYEDGENTYATLRNAGKFVASRIITVLSRRMSMGMSKRL